MSGVPRAAAQPRAARLLRQGAARRAAAVRPARLRQDVPRARRRRRARRAGLRARLNDVLDMWLGESERRLHDAFAAARRTAPCVLFLDELDALGQKRSHQRRSAGRNVVNQLLAELDGAQADNEGLFVLAATNHPWDVDTALRRPGRLDRTVLVLPPTEPARRAIRERGLARRPVQGVGAAKLARQADGYSGADLVHIVETATEEALARSARTGALHPLTQADVDVARKQVRPSTRAWFEVAHNYALYANEGGEYDELLAYIREKKRL